jgi:hypothetical protein
MGRIRRTAQSLGLAGAGVALLAILGVSAASVAHGVASRDSQSGARTADTSFAATVARLSEAPGYFDTDNLISNETSYLHAVTRLRELGTTGGAYVGVGPDQSFSYIAAVSPAVAFLVDIRRDNLLMHLLFRALFERSQNRLEYLCRWLGRAVPADVSDWRDRPVADIVAAVDAIPADPRTADATLEDLLRTVRGFGVPLADSDLMTIRRFHGEFARLGLDLRFTSVGRAPRPGYPDLRELILARDLDGEQVGYLSSHERWATVRALQRAGQVIPVVGNLGGSRAFPEIGREVAARGLTVSALYVSNVEMYLWRDGQFEQYAQTVASLPRSSRSVVIRSFFGGGFGQNHPLRVTGHLSTQLVQPMDDFAARWRRGGWGSYWELVTAGNR